MAKRRIRTTLPRDILDAQPPEDVFGDIVREEQDSLRHLCIEAGVPQKEVDQVSGSTVRDEIKLTSMLVRRLGFGDLMDGKPGARVPPPPLPKKR